MINYDRRCHHRNRNMLLFFGPNKLELVKRFKKSKKFVCAKFRKKKIENPFTLSDVEDVRKRIRTNLSPTDRF